MAIWSAYNRVSCTLSRSICEECSGNGQTPPTKEQIEQMVCGTNICESCSGSGLNKSISELLYTFKETLQGIKE